MSRVIRDPRNHRVDKEGNHHSLRLEDGESIRLFVAINLPSEVKEAVVKQQNSIRSHLSSQTRTLRWVQPESIHLTLLFLGDVPLKRLDDAKSALQGACENTSSFKLRLSGVGCFPNVRRPRVLWSGVEGDTAALQQLQTQVSNHLQPFVAKAEDKRFHPHLTLARIKAEDKKLSHQIGQVIHDMDKHRENIAWAIDSIELMRSVLKPSGSEYSIEESILLNKNKL